MALPEHPVGREFTALLYRAQFERWLAKELAAILEASWRELERDLLSRYADLSLRDRRRIAALAIELRRHIEATYASVARRSADVLSEYGTIERDAAAALIARFRSALTIGEVGPVVSRAQLLSIAELPVHGLTLGEWWAEQARTMTLRVRRAIQTGLVLGKSLPEIARHVTALRPVPGQQVPSIARQARRDATAIVRTSVTAVQAHAAETMYTAAGLNIVPQMVFHATIDERTCPICGAQHGATFAVDDPKGPRPPLHIGCRCILLPKLDWAAMGMEDPDPNTDMRNYGAWLRGQSIAQQNLILGTSRAALWRARKLTLADLLGEDGGLLTVVQLRQKLAA